jgi:preprotein translocase subunit SecE
MSIVKSEDGKKWINAFKAIISILVAIVTIRFAETMGEWFELESKITYFLAVSQGLGVFAGLVTFLTITKNKLASTHLDEVYAELVKVVWPDKDSVIKVTIGIVIATVFVSGFFVLIDFTFRKILNLLY